MIAVKDFASIADESNLQPATLATHDGWQDSGFDIADECSTLYNGPPALEDCPRSAMAYANDLESRCHGSLPCDMTKCVVDELP